MPHSPNEFVTFSKSKKLRYVISDQAHWIKYTHVYNLFMYNQDIYNMVIFSLNLRFYNNLFMCTFMYWIALLTKIVLFVHHNFTCGSCISIFQSFFVITYAHYISSSDGFSYYLHEPKVLVLLKTNFELELKFMLGNQGTPTSIVGFAYGLPPNLTIINVST